MAKCIKSAPWPAVIRCFRGYDAHEVQVFTVDFVESPYSAELETYCMSALNGKKIKKMLENISQTLLLHKALRQAERIFKSL